MGVLPLSNSSMNFPSRGAKIIIEATGSNNIFIVQFDNFITRGAIVREAEIGALRPIIISRYIKLF